MVMEFSLGVDVAWRRGPLGCAYTAGCGRVGTRYFQKIAPLRDPRGIGSNMVNLGSLSMGMPY
jgi:hypothetical protein